MNRIVRAAAFAAMSAVVVMASGCATTSTKRAQAVEDRATKRWELLIAGKADEAYDFLTEGYRSTHTKDGYVAAKTHTAITWKDAKFSDKQCESEEVCTVRILLTYTLNMHASMAKPVQASTYESEKWIKSGGQWFHLPHE